MRLQDRTSNSVNGTKANGVFSVFFPSIIRERACIRERDGPTKKQEREIKKKREKEYW